MNNIDSSDLAPGTNPRIVFGDTLPNKKHVAFDTDNLPNSDTYNRQQLSNAYLSAFEMGINNFSEENSLGQVLKKIHADALGEVNWKKTIQELEGGEFAESSNYQSGDFRRGIPTRLTFAYGAKGVVYDAPTPEKGVELIADLDTFLSKQEENLERLSDEYFDLAASISILTFIAHPFLGGNKRVIRPLITHVLTRGGLVGRWLEGDRDFIESFKNTWANLVFDFQKNIGGENANEVENYDERWLKYWQEKINSGSILSDKNIQNFGKTIKNSPYYSHALRQKVSP